VSHALGIEPGIVQAGVDVGLQSSGAAKSPGQGGGTQDPVRAFDQVRGVLRPNPLEVLAQVEVTHVAADFGQGPLVHLLPARDAGTARPERGAERGRGLPDGGHDTPTGHDYAARVVEPTVRTHSN
jgi:hypothetical protein